MNKEDADVKAMRMPYSVYKKYYKDCKTVEGSYNASNRTIYVYLPAQTVEFPKTWKRNGNHYETPGGARVYFWNTGASRSYVVEYGDMVYNYKSRTIVPGMYSKEKVLQTVEEFEWKA